MTNELFLNLLSKFKPSNVIEIKNAMKEVLQSIILTGISKSDFFKKAVFYGGTSLRLLRGLPRYSEDLDFTLTLNDEKFELSNYFKYIDNELRSYGFIYEYNNKNKEIITSVDSVYFKFNLKYLFEISYNDYINQITPNEVLSIKVEVEKNGINGGGTEYKLLTYPSFVRVRTFTMDTMFASKIIAVLNRKWKNRIKGRDFYDYLFYISLHTKVNLTFLENGLKKFGYLEENDKLTLERLKIELKERFETIDFSNALLDVKPFVSSGDIFIDSFNKDIFISTIDMIFISEE